MRNIFLAVMMFLAVSIPSIGKAQSGLDATVAPVPVNSPIADVSGVLSEETKTSLFNKIKDLQTRTKADIGIEIIPSLNDYQPYEIGMETIRKWGIGAKAEIGSAQRNLGVLILVVPKTAASGNKGTCWVATATGAEGLITDSRAAEFCRESFHPPVDYNESVTKLVGLVSERLEQAQAEASRDSLEALKPKVHYEPDWPAIIFGLVGFLLFGLAVRGLIAYNREKLYKKQIDTLTSKNTILTSKLSNSVLEVSEWRNKFSDLSKASKELVKVNDTLTSRILKLRTKYEPELLRQEAEAEAARKAEEARLERLRQKQLAAQRKRDEQEEEEERSRPSSYSSSDYGSSSGYSSSDSSSGSSFDFGGGGSSSGGGGGSSW